MLSENIKLSAFVTNGNWFPVLYISYWSRSEVNAMCITINPINGVFCGRFLPFRCVESVYQMCSKCVGKALGFKFSRTLASFRSQCKGTFRYEGLMGKRYNVDFRRRRKNQREVDSFCQSAAVMKNAFAMLRNEFIRLLRVF